MTSKRGGKRTGAGRKPRSDKPSPTSVYFEHDVKLLLDRKRGTRSTTRYLTDLILTDASLDLLPDDTSSH